MGDNRGRFVGTFYVNKAWMITSRIKITPGKKPSFISILMGYVSDRRRIVFDLAGCSKKTLRYWVVM